jgi:polyhydroxyalkanoate synthesis regulator phasin
MNLKSRWIAIASGVMVAGAVSAGAAMAATGSTTPAPTQAPAQTQAQSRAQSEAARIQAAVASGKLTQAQADVLKQLGDLRQAAMAKVKTDEKAVLDQAVASGKLTQAEADKLLQRGEMGGQERGKGGHGNWGHKGADLTPAQFKANLDQQVKDGKLTQAQADTRMQQFTAAQAKEGAETNDDATQAPATQTPAPTTSN